MLRHKFQERRREGTMDLLLKSWADEVVTAQAARLVVGEPDPSLVGVASQILLTRCRWKLII